MAATSSGRTDSQLPKVMDVNFQGVILAGGKGTRLWPISRLVSPKQFISLGPSGKCLLQVTAERLLKLVKGWDNVWVVTISEFAERVKYLLPDLPKGNLLVESEGRNSAPAIALALIEITRCYGEDVITGFFPADHWVEDEINFQRAIHLGSRIAAQQGTIMALGLPPRHPSTSLGYIEVGELIGIPEGIPVYNIRGFKEKPDKSMAAKYLESGRFLWNSGIVILQAKYGLEEFRFFAPEILRLLSLRGDVPYSQIPNISFDRAIMERCTRASVISVDFGWDDLGEWSSVEQLLAKGALGQTSANHLAFGAEGTLFISTEKEEVIIAIGVKNVIIVRSGNVTAVVSRERISEISETRERVISQLSDEHFL